MKYFLCLFFGLFLFNTVNAQYEDLMIPQNEVSFNLFSVKNRQVVDGGPSYYPYYFQGITYRRKIQNSLLRFSFGYFQKHDKLSTSVMESQGNLTEIEFGAGYQRNFLEKKIKPYVAADLTISGGRQEKENEANADDFFETFDSRFFGLGVTPVVGVRLQATSVLSFSIEFGVQFVMLWENGTKFHWEPNVVPAYTDYQNNRFEVRPNPVTALFITLEF